MLTETESFVNRCFQCFLRFFNSSWPIFKLQLHQSFFFQNHELEFFWVCFTWINERKKHLHIKLKFTRPTGPITTTNLQSAIVSRIKMSEFSTLKKISFMNMLNGNGSIIAPDEFSQIKVIISNYEKSVLLRVHKYNCNNPYWSSSFRQDWSNIKRKCLAQWALQNPS